MAGVVRPVVNYDPWTRMSDYVLDHHLEGERARLALMSRLLDPMHRRYIETLGVGPGTRALEVGCGNGSIWAGWLSWSRKRGIDYMIGRRLPQLMAAVGLEQISATAETALYNGGSSWAQYWEQTIIELRDGLVGAGDLDARSIDVFLAHC